MHTRHMTTTQKTPGYNCRLEIFFTTDRRGRKIAHRWSTMQLRSFRMSLAEAELLVATGAADEIAGNPFKVR
jgi:hypothetical protein